MEEKKIVELKEDQLEQVAGGVINVFDAPSPKQSYYKCTCHAGGQVGVGVVRPSECAFCKSKNITCEEYNP